jgi:upstream activation factor subunit UAF30
LIEARFDAISTQPSGADTIPTPSSASTKKELAATNGHGSNNEDADADGEIEVSFPIGEPAKKRKRYSSDLEDADARLAAELQAQENRMARGRSTRGGGVAKPKKKVSKKKSDKKVRAGDDSDVDASEDSGTPKKRKAGGGFQKEFNLSYPLAELVGTSQVCPILSHRFLLGKAINRGDSCLGPRSSRSCGSTSRRTSCRIPRTSAR